MTEKLIPTEGKKGKVKPSPEKAPDKKPAEGPNAANPISDLQQQVGNRAVQRLIAQRQAGPAEADEETASQINQMRGGGQALDGAVQREMGTKMGADFSGVNVHSSPESDDLNKRLGAKAFTTGQDIFFRQGEYAPNSDSGKELLAHELTHVVQQRKGGDLEPAPKMLVNPPDDAYERQADVVAKQVTGPAAVQAQEQEEPREEELQAKLLQRQVEEEEPSEEEVQTMTLQRQEEEELVMPQAIQRASDLEEEQPLQGKWLQRQEMDEEEEMLQARRLQRQETPEEEREEEVQTKRLQSQLVQRQDIPEDEQI